MFVQIAFVVKHEAVGGQGEVLARCVFQIPDLVAACRWAKYSRNQSTCTMTIPSNLVWFWEPVAGIAMANKWNVDMVCFGLVVWFGSLVWFCLVFFGLFAWFGLNRKVQAKWWGANGMSSAAGTWATRRACPQYHLWGRGKTWNLVSFFLFREGNLYHNDYFDF